MILWQGGVARLLIGMLAATVLESGGGPASVAGMLAVSPPRSEKELPANQPEKLKLGVQTHFSQGWTPDALDRARSVGALLLRDSLSWRDVARANGRFAFDSAAARSLDKACEQGFHLILTAVPRRADLDSDPIIHSPEARDVFAAYVRALANHYGPCLAGIQIGNEINSANRLAVPPGIDQARNYVATVKAVKEAIAVDHPTIAVVAGSTNSTGTGFLETLFKAGLLDHVDAISVHPYKGDPRSVGFEIANLRKVALHFGKTPQIWATEFSQSVDDPGLAAARLAQQVTLMAEAGVSVASWYALDEQRWYPNLGLFAGSRVKPVGQAYRIVAQELLGRGPPMRIATSDPLVFAYSFGRDRMLVWGSGQSVRFAPGATVADVAGHGPQPLSLILTDRPLLVRGPTRLTVEASPVIADSLAQFGTGDWDYLLQKRGGELLGLSLINDRYDSYFGSRFFRPLAIRANGGAPAGDGRNPLRAVWRYRATRPIQGTFAACLRKSDKGDGVDITISRDERPLTRANLVGGERYLALPVHLAVGESVSISVGPNLGAGGDSFALRAAIVRSGYNWRVPCP